MYLENETRKGNLELVATKTIRRRWLASLWFLLLTGLFAGLPFVLGGITDDLGVGLMSLFVCWLILAPLALITSLVFAGIAMVAQMKATREELGDQQANKLFTGWGFAILAVVLVGVVVIMQNTNANRYVHNMNDANGNRSEVAVLEQEAWLVSAVTCLRAPQQLQQLNELEQGITDVDTLSVVRQGIEEVRGIDLSLCQSDADELLKMMDEQGIEHQSMNWMEVYAGAGVDELKLDPETVDPLPVAGWFQITPPMVAESEQVEQEAQDAVNQARKELRAAQDPYNQMLRTTTRLNNMMAEPE